MSKHIDNIKKIKYKQSRLNGNNICNSLKEAGYSKASAEGKNSALGVVKVCELEIAKEFQGAITVEMVLNRIGEDRNNANSKGDFSTALQADIALGKYLAMFTDKTENKTTITEDRRTELDSIAKRLGLTQ